MAFSSIKVPHSRGKRPANAVISFFIRNGSIVEGEKEKYPRSVARVISSKHMTAACAEIRGKKTRCTSRVFYFRTLSHGRDRDENHSHSEKCCSAVISLSSAPTDGVERRSGGGERERGHTCVFRPTNIFIPPPFIFARRRERRIAIGWSEAAD